MKKNIFITVTLIFMMVLSGCTNILVDTPYLNYEKNAVKIEAEDDLNIYDNTKTDISGTKCIEMIDANKKFSWELFKVINDEDSNKEVFMSPLSVSSMLMMAFNGAEGTTKDVMAKTMYYDGLSIEEVNEGYKYLISKINNIDEKVTAEIANSIWIRKGFEIKQSFIDTNQNYLSADIKSLDFSKESAAIEMNDWVSNKTNNLIPSIINPPIHSNVMMYLINAIYFKGEWTEAFKQENTYEADFHSYDGLTDKVQMMYRSSDIDLARFDDFSAVSLPYGNEKVNMMVILPTGDINEFVNNFDYKKWDMLLENMRAIPDLSLHLPKFEMEYGIKQLNQSLTALGLGEIFSESANFSGIGNNLCISKVLHKAVIDVNEEGTEAAAVTVGEMVATAYVEPVEFVVNRPFMFVIYDSEDGNILFTGKKLFGER